MICAYPRGQLLPSLLNLRPGVAYLLVGDLKDLYGSLAVQMARHGERNFITCSKSGIREKISVRIMRECRSYECEVSETKGVIDFIHNVF